MRHIVVTGGNSGLGAALVEYYVRKSDHVTCVARDRTRLEAVAQRCEAVAGRRPDLIACDVTDAVRLRDLLRQIDLDLPVDVLIANAGMGGRDVLASPHGEAEPLARSIVAVNLLGVVNSVTPLVEPMSVRRKGHIVIIGSVAAFVALPQSPVYSAAKAAARSYGHGLRRLLRTQGIDVTVVSPGFIDTPMSRSLPFYRPFLVDAQRAATIIAHAIDRRRAELIFPWPYRVAATLLGALPTAVTDRLVAMAAAAADRECP